MAEARMDDLDLTVADDRAIYRQRVAHEYAHMHARHVIAAARKLTGKPCATKQRAMRLIADWRIEAASHDDTTPRRAAPPLIVSAAHNPTVSEDQPDAT